MDYAITIPALVSMLPTVHTGVAGILDGHPRADDASRIAASLAANAMRYSAGEITVRVVVADAVRIEVADQRGRQPREGEAPTTGGDPLAIASRVASRMGSRRDRRGDCLTWAEITTIPDAQPDFPSGTEEEDPCVS